MALTRCYCGAHQLDPQHAIYVKDGHPLCREYTCRRVRERMDEEMRMERHLMPVVTGRDPGDEHHPPFIVIEEITEELA